MLIAAVADAWQSVEGRYGGGDTLMGQEKTKQDKKMCEHKRLVFLGKQDMPMERTFLALFNCEDCRSTISLKMVKKNFKRRPGRPGSPWAQ